ncbi:MAG: hypothetical protein ACR2OM_15780, partial [Aestuariivirgaceae bacterium]
MKRFILVAVSMLLSGCLTDLEEFAAQPPHLTPVGSGLVEPASMQARPVMPQRARTGGGYSLWQDNA